MRSVQKVFSQVLWKIQIFEEDTRYKEHRHHYPMCNDASIPFKVGTLGPHTVLPITTNYPSYFPESQWLSEISSFSKVNLVLGKTRSCKVPNLGCSGGLSHLGNLIFCWKTLHKMWCISRHVVVMKLPITRCPLLQPSASSE